VIVYSGTLDDAADLIRFFRRESGRLRALRKVVVSPQATVVLDVNRDGIEIPGLTYGNPTLEELLRELGVVFSAQTLHNPHATPDGVKEFRLSARYPWGQDRVM